MSYASAPWREFGALLESAGEGMIVLDERGRIRLVNRVVAENIGIPAEELVGTNAMSFLPAEERKRIRKAAHAGQLAGLLKGADFRARNASGEIRLWTLTLVADHAESGTYLFFARDVTEERRAGLELARTHGFLASIVDANEDAVLAVNDEGLVLLYNRRCAHVFGYSVGDVVGHMGISDLFSAKSAEELRAYLSDADGTDAQFRLRTDAVTSQNAVVPTLTRASRLVIDGRPVGMVLFVKDIADRPDVEQRLNQAFADQRDETTREEIAAEIAGMVAHELNQPLTSLLTSTQLLLKQLDQESHESKTLRIIEEQASRMAEVIRKLARVSRYETTSYVGSQRILDLDRAVSRSEYPSRRPAANDQPSTPAPRKTFDISDVSSHSAATLAHEVANPLTAIAVYAARVLTKIEDEQLRKDLQRIVDNTSRIERLLADVRQKSRPKETGVEALDITALVETSLVYCDHTLARSGVSIVRNYSHEVLRTWGHKDQLYQVLVNIITNASQAAPESGGVIEITTRAVDDGTLEIRIGDNGSGIPPALHERLFSPYVSTKAPSGGTGLGLVIAKSIVDTHRGTIRAENRANGGAEFVITLPRAVVAR